jgi:electron transfer flavoprotein alpha subunit
MTMTKTDARGVLILGEMAGETPLSIVPEMIALARQVVGADGGPVCVLLVGAAPQACISGLISVGADRVYLAPPGPENLYGSEVWMDAVAAVLAQFHPQVVMSGHTSLGADLAPRIALASDLSIATGCENLVLEGGSLLATRPCYGHKAREVLKLLTMPAVVTVRARSAQPQEPVASRVGETIAVDVQYRDAALLPKIRSRTQEDSSEGPSLEQAKIVVAGGRGLGGPEGFQHLATLAEVLGGAVGASRVACDLGWCPRSWQIGLTGKTVMPNLYIAVGISGASHHMAGCGNSGTILVINNDQDAAIFKDARFGVVGDYQEILPELVRQLADRKAQAA